MCKQACLSSLVFNVSQVYGLVQVDLDVRTCRESIEPQTHNWKLSSYNPCSIIIPSDVQSCGNSTICTESTIKHDNFS